MSNNLSKLNTWELIEELKTRGYNTELVFSIYDVEARLEIINMDREEHEHIVLDKDDKFEILRESFNPENLWRRILEEIDDKILDDYDDESYFKGVEE